MQGQKSSRLGRKEAREDCELSVERADAPAPQHRLAVESFAGLAYNHSIVYFPILFVIYLEETFRTQKTL